jgi:hypothetical protein
VRSCIPLSWHSRACEACHLRAQSVKLARGYFHETMAITYRSSVRPFYRHASRRSSATKVGLLSCNMGPTIGMIVGSHQHLHCRFTPDAGGPSELYSGSITRIGLDVGFRAGGAMAWAVFAPTLGLRHGALRGHYVGAKWRCVVRPGRRRQAAGRGIAQDDFAAAAGPYGASRCQSRPGRRRTHLALSRAHLLSSHPRVTERPAAADGQHCAACRRRSFS